MIVKNNYPLIVPKKDESIKKDFPIEKIFCSNSFEDNSKYRQIGVYVISDDLSFMDKALIDYMVNNHSLRSPNVLLHFDIREFNQGRSPFKFYKIKDEFKHVCIDKFVGDKIFFKYNLETFQRFLQNNGTVFEEISWSCSAVSPITKLILLKHKNLLKKTLDQNRLDLEYLNSQIKENSNALVWNKTREILGEGKGLESTV